MRACSVTLPLIRRAGADLFCIIFKVIINIHKRHLVYLKVLLENMKIWTKGAACLPERYCSQSAKKRRAVKFGIFVQNVHENTWRKQLCEQ